MAGTDATVPVDDPLTRLLLRSAQRRARDYGIRLTYRRQGPAYYVAVDGPLKGIQAFVRTLPDHLASVAEGAHTASPLRERRRIATAVAMRIAVRVEALSSDVHRLAGRLGGVPNSFLFDSAPAHLTGRLTDFAQHLMMFYEGDLAPATALEETHSVLEELLRQTYKDRSAQFMTLVMRADEDRLIRNGLADFLQKLNRWRRDTKHRGAGISWTIAAELIDHGVLAAHLLVAALNERDSG